MQLKISLLSQTRTVWCCETNKCIAVGTNGHTFFQFFSRLRWIGKLRWIGNFQILNLAEGFKELSEVIFSRIVREVFYEQVAPLFGSLELGCFVLDRLDSFSFFHTGRNIKGLFSTRQKLSMHFLKDFLSTPWTVLSVFCVAVAEAKEVDVTLISQFVKVRGNCAKGIK